LGFPLVSIGTKGRIWVTFSSILGTEVGCLVQRFIRTFKVLNGFGGWVKFGITSLRIIIGWKLGKDFPFLIGGIILGG